MKWSQAFIPTLREAPADAEIVSHKLLLPLLLLALPVAVNAQFTFTTNNGTITITRYTGSGGEMMIPTTINGLPVTCIGTGAFEPCSGLVDVTIPDIVTKNRLSDALLPHPLAVENG